MPKLQRKSSDLLVAEAVDIRFRGRGQLRVSLPRRRLRLPERRARLLHVAQQGAAESCKAAATLSRTCSGRSGLGMGVTAFDVVGDLLPGLETAHKAVQVALRPQAGGR